MSEDTVLDDFLTEAGEIGTDTNDDIKDEIETPSMYKVLLINDDYTPSEFVIYILESVFHKTNTQASSLMSETHKNGVGICGVYIKDIAEIKVATSGSLAKGSGFPLMCVVEKE